MGRHGGFADKVRAKEEWTIPLNQAMDHLRNGKPRYRIVLVPD